MPAFKSHNEKETGYFFTNMHFITAEHLRQGLFIKQHCEMLGKLEVNLSDPSLPLDEQYRAVLEDVAHESVHPEFAALWEDKNYDAVRRWLHALGLEDDVSIYHVRYFPASHKQQ